MIARKTRPAHWLQGALRLWRSTAPLVVTVLAVWLCAGTAAGQSPANAADSYLAALDAEVMGGDASRASKLYQQAGTGSAGDAYHQALLGQARALLRQEDYKGFAQVVGRLSTGRSLAPAQADELTRLKRLRDELSREQRRPAPAAAGGSRPQDVTLKDASLEDASAALSSLYGVTMVADSHPARVNLSLKGVALPQALLAVAFQSGLSVWAIGRTFFVGRPGRLNGLLLSNGSRKLEDLFDEAQVPSRTPLRSNLTLSIENQPVGDVVRRLADGFGVNIVAIVASPRLSLDLLNVGLDGALRALASQLGWEVHTAHGLYFVATREHLAIYFPGFERRYLKLKHISAGGIYDDVQDFLTKERLKLARTEVDVVGNALIVEGAKGDLDRVETFLSLLDEQRSSLGLELVLRDRAGTEVEESPREKVRMLAGQPAVVTLVAPSAIDKAQGGQVQLMVELTPRVKGAKQVIFDLRWRVASLKKGIIVDVKEGSSSRVTGAMGSQIDVPILSGAPPAPRDLVLVIGPEE
ncbi:MAG: hypothetical protein HY815_01405 [Candidatus Riflebacteria bacterium]|nr:hypothetical protein [Candidatus Riflebacteria bacterium]